MADISSIIDGFFFGYDTTLVLLGITIAQAWVYAHNNNDKWVLRTFVTVLVLLDFAETACATQVVRFYLVNNFGNLDALKSPIDTASADFTLASVIFFMVHMFFAYRLWKLGGSWWLPAIITLTSTAMLALGGTVISLQMSGRLVFSDYAKDLMMTELTAFHALAVVTDILITVGLSWKLSTTHTSFKSTRMVLQRLLVFTATRGILVALVQVGHIVMYVLDPRNMLFWNSLHLIVTKIYVLTTLVTLNSRNSFRDKLEEAVPDDFHLSFVRTTPSHATNNGVVSPVVDTLIH